MSTELFTREDIERIVAEGLTVERIEEQIEIFRRGVPPVTLNRPCTLNDGIVPVTDLDMDHVMALYDEAVREGRMLKFVPASGAASRMFRDWHKFLDEEGTGFGEPVREFFSDLKGFAFYNDLREIISRSGEDIEHLIDAGKYVDVLDYILTSKGLNYGNLPKALLKFHDYPDGNRTSLEEHLVEAVGYVKDAKRVCRVRFTVSDEHVKYVKDRVSRVVANYERRYDALFEISFSVQESSTNTIAVDMENRPFRDHRGSLVFRPGGHGAILNNLNSVDGDIIFLKNIDNVVPDRLKPATIFHKKALGGYLVLLQNEIFKYLKLLSRGEVDEKTVSNIVAFCRRVLHIVFPPSFAGLSHPEKCQYIFRKLNRPIRVCGMVKNEGEPGGGPFWVDEGDGTQSLQIIEQSQVDMDSLDQKAIWSSSTHFNPVDLVCGVRDYLSRKFNLSEFVDQNTYFISQKSEKGRDLRALELPGLWNGSMAYWNTIFVEVPIETFNPVKTVYDLLRPQHLPEV